MRYSEMARLMTCPRRYQHEFIDGLGGGESAATRFGTAWHKIMELWGQSKGASVEEILSAALEQVKWQDDEVDYRTADKLQKGFRAWLLHDANSSALQLLRTEIMVMLPAIELTGRIDGLVMWDAGHGQGKELWVLDYKTTSRLSMDWVTEYRVSNQFKFYQLMASETWEKEYGTPIAGVVVDLYHATKGVKKTTNKNDKDGNHFHRISFQYSDQHLNEAKNDLQMAKAMEGAFIQAKYFPRNTDACKSYGTTCPFIDICDLPPGELREKAKGMLTKNEED